MGDPACWAHLQGDRPDIRGRHDVQELLREFYRLAIMDDLLGPIFEREVVDWRHHLQVVTDFWVGQLFGGDDYRGHPLRAHERAAATTPFTDRHFERWLDLFAEVVESRHSGPVADQAIGKARRFARAMQRVLGRPAGLRLVPGVEAEASVHRDPR